MEQAIIKAILEAAEKGEKQVHDKQFLQEHIVHYVEKLKHDECIRAIVFYTLKGGQYEIVDLMPAGIDLLNDLRNNNDQSPPIKGFH